MCKYLVRVWDIEYNDEVAAGSPTEISFVVEEEDICRLEEISLRKVVEISGSQDFDCLCNWEALEN